MRPQRQPEGAGAAVMKDLLQHADDVIKAIDRIVVQHDRIWRLRIGLGVGDRTFKLLWRKLFLDDLLNGGGHVTTPFSRSVLSRNSTPCPLRVYEIPIGPPSTPGQRSNVTRSSTFRAKYACSSTDGCQDRISSAALRRSMACCSRSDRPASQTS